MSEEMQEQEAGFTGTLDTSEQVESESLDAQGSDSSTDTEQPQEVKVEFNEAQQAKVNELIGQKTFKVREAEREAEALRQQLREAQAKLPQEQAPTVPPIPDPYDDDYEQRLAERDNAVMAKAAFDERQKVILQQQQFQQQQAQQQQQQELVQTIQSYSERADKLGIDKQQLQVAGQTVASYGINDDLTQHILNDDKGPLITTHLAKNPGDLEALRTMSPMQAAVYIETNVKPKVAVKSQTNATAPVDSLNGGGTPPTDRGPKGATFE